MKKKISYLTRIFKAYVLNSKSQLSFWHGAPEINPDAFKVSHNEFSLHYFMKFEKKAQYKEYLDSEGVPMLNYHGDIGMQYNPIALSQYGLGNINLYLKTKDELHLKAIQNTVNWFQKNIQKNEQGVEVWMHLFDFEYAETLKNPWYSGLAQGQIISFLLRASVILKDDSLKILAERAFESFKILVDQGGVVFIDDDQNLWIEEYIVRVPTHILNGFIWAFWGIHDYSLFYPENNEASKMKQKMIETLTKNLDHFDCGYWSLYDLSRKPLKNLASHFYHSLHIVQLDIMHRLTGEQKFQDYQLKWTNYQNSTICRYRSFLMKSFFKILFF